MLEATSPDGEPWPGEGRASFEWHESGAHLIARSMVDLPDAPNTVSIIGSDAANRTYYQLYSDDPGVCRVYEMSIGDSNWRLWRTGEPFPQRFTGRFEDNGNMIVGRWEKAEDGEHYQTDFDLVYRKVHVRRDGPATEGRSRTRLQCRLAGSLLTTHSGHSVGTGRSTVA